MPLATHRGERAAAAHTYVRAEAANLVTRVPSIGFCWSSGHPAQQTPVTAVGPLSCQLHFRHRAPPHHHNKM